MKNNWLLIVVVVCAIGFYRYWKVRSSHNNVMQQKESSVMVVNVLDKEYFDDCHIPGSIHVSILNLEDQARSWNKQAKIIVYCSNYACTASAAVARKLKDMGFVDVFAYEAGIAGWYQAKLPVEGPSKEFYLTLPNEKIDTSAYADVAHISTEQLADLLHIKYNENGNN